MDDLGDTPLLGHLHVHMNLDFSGAPETPAAARFQFDLKLDHHPNHRRIRFKTT